MEIQGKILMIGETQNFGSNNFRKREIAVQTEEQYPQSILIEFIQDKTALLDNFRRGTTVKIGVNLRGREWINPQGEAKYFNTIQGWRIEPVAGSQPAPQGARTGSAVDQYQAKQKHAGDEFLNGEFNQTEEDDLPF